MHVRQEDLQATNQEIDHMQRIDPIQNIALYQNPHTENQPQATGYYT